LAIFVVQRWAQITAGAAGIAVIAVEYFNSLNDPERTVQLREGAFLALLGFVLVLVAGVLPDSALPKPKAKRK
jgi:drug/metabolite transporter (DMT)-like permease